MRAVGMILLMMAGAFLSFVGVFYLGGAGTLGQFGTGLLLLGTGLALLGGAIKLSRGTPA